MKTSDQRALKVQRNLSRTTQLTAATAGGVYGRPATSLALAEEYALAEEQHHYVVRVYHVASSVLAKSRTPMRVSGTPLERTLSRDDD